MIGDLRFSQSQGKFKIGPKNVNLEIGVTVVLKICARRGPNSSFNSFSKAIKMLLN